MNKQLLLYLAQQAENNCCATRVLPDGQLERTWKPNDFYVEYSKLILQEVLEQSYVFTRARFAKSNGKVKEYEQGLIDGEEAVRLRILKHFGVSNEESKSGKAGKS
jgi:hypothetical protein